jgi:hypothetical protein
MSDAKPASDGIFAKATGGGEPLTDEVPNTRLFEGRIDHLQNRKSL